MIFKVVRPKDTVFLTVPKYLFVKNAVVFLKQKKESTNQIFNIIF